MAVSAARALFNSADTEMPGHQVLPPAPGTMGYNGPELNYADWDTRGADGRYVPQIERFLNYGAPPSSSSSIELSTVPITWQFQVPELPDGTPDSLMPGMPVFSVTERGPADLESTLILSLSKINQYARDQWTDFMSYTAGGPLTNPHFNHELRRFHTSMRVYGERGLRDYHWARKNAEHDHVASMLLAKYDSAGCTTKSRWRRDIDPLDSTGVTFETPLSLRDYYERSTQPGYCYLTQFGFLQRLRFLGFVQTVMKGVSAEDCMEQGPHTFELGVAVAKQVEVTNCFGTDDEIGLGSRLWIQLNRVYCPGLASTEIPYGAFQLCPRGSKLMDYPRFSDIGFQDESGTQCAGFYWRVGVVIEPPQRAAEQSSITQANNTGMFSNPDISYKLNALLPTMRVAVGFRN
jgi:hypothetical protein